MKGAESDREIQVRTITGESTTVSISSHSTIEDLKKLLLNQSFLPASNSPNFHLFFKASLSLSLSLSLSFYLCSKFQLFFHFHHDSWLPRKPNKLETENFRVFWCLMFHFEYNSLFFDNPSIYYTLLLNQLILLVIFCFKLSHSHYVCVCVSFIYMVVIANFLLWHCM